MNEKEPAPFIWTPIKLTDKATGRSVYISILEREMYLSGFFTFEDLWEIAHERLDIGSRDKDDN